MKRPVFIEQILGPKFTIGDGFDRITPLKEEEKTLLEEALGRSLDARACAALIDAMRRIIFVTEKKRDAPTLNDYQNHLLKIRQASDALLMALGYRGLSSDAEAIMTKPSQNTKSPNKNKDENNKPDKMSETSFLIRYELDRALGQTPGLITLLEEIKKTRTFAHRAIKHLQAETSRRGKRVNVAEKMFLKDLVDITGATKSELPAKRHDASNENGKGGYKANSTRPQLLDFFQRMLWLTVDRAKEIPGIAPEVITSLENLGARDYRALRDVIEPLMG